MLVSRHLHRRFTAAKIAPVPHMSQADAADAYAKTRAGRANVASFAADPAIFPCQLSHETLAAGKAAAKAAAAAWGERSLALLDAEDRLSVACEKGATDDDVLLRLRAVYQVCEGGPRGGGHVSNSECGVGLVNTVALQTACASSCAVYQPCCMQWWCLLSMGSTKHHLSAAAAAAGQSVCWPLLTPGCPSYVTQMNMYCLHAALTSVVQQVQFCLSLFQQLHPHVPSVLAPAALLCCRRCCQSTRR